MIGRITKTTALVRALAALFLALSFSACSASTDASRSVDASEQEQISEQMSGEIPVDTTGGSPWLDSNVEGNVAADLEVSPKDDLYLSVNRDWLASARIPEGSPSLSENWNEEGLILAQRTVAEAELEGHDARQAQLLYRAASDTVARDAAGCEPARATVDDLRSLTTTAELSAFLLDAERSAGVTPPITVGNYADGDRYVTKIRLAPETFGSSPETLGMDATMVDPQDDLYQTRCALASAVLTRLGYTKDEAEAAFAHRVELERRVVEASGEDGGGEDELTLTLDELNAFAGDFPLKSIVEGRGYAGANEFRVSDVAAVKAMAALYAQDNVELVRDYLVCGYALEVGSWLDETTYVAWAKDQVVLGQNDQLVLTDPKDSERLAFQLAVRFIPTCVGRAFVEGCGLEDSKACVEKLFADATKTHKGLIADCAWLSDASKKQLFKKLDDITVYAVYPDAWEDYGTLDLTGLDYFAARRAIWLNDIARDAAHTGEAVADGLWSEPSLVNLPAIYDPWTNSIHISAGIAEPFVSRYLAGETTLLDLMGGGLGNMIFHEIAHSFGENAIDLGSDGNPVEGSLLTSDDLAEYRRRVQRISDYYDTIYAWKGQPITGSLVTNEALAEMCGMRAQTAYVSSLKGFDPKAFFEGRARIQRWVRTTAYELQCIKGADTHPLAYLNVNVALQQLDEFYETYDVGEGDAMYLAPEDRLNLW